MRELEDTPRPAGTAPRYRAVVFDMDGVVTDTAQLHAAAWEQLFDEVLAAHTAPDGSQMAPFDPDVDYRLYVDGRSREDGVALFLAARGLQLPLGSREDRPGTDTVWALAARKNRLFLELAEREGIRAFPSTIDFVHRLHGMGVRTAVVTASRNAAAILAAASIADLFEVVVDGTDAASLRLPGKPDAALFVEAARRLGVDPVDAGVVEDSAAGVEAARRGGFGLVVGVDRRDRRDDLLAAGADTVVDDLAQLDLGALRTDPWRLVYEGEEPLHEGHRETLCALGNGYLATRGAAPEFRDDGVHYPGTYLAGVYNRLTTTLPGRLVEDEQLVNVPNWLPFDLRIDGGPWWSSGELRTLHDRRELDLRRAVLTRRMLLADATDRRLRITQRRLVSIARPHAAALETTLVAENWSGRVEVRSGIDACRSRDA